MSTILAVFLSCALLIHVGGATRLQAPTPLPVPSPIPPPGPNVTPVPLPPSPVPRQIPCRDHELGGLFSVIGSLRGTSVVPPVTSEATGGAGFTIQVSCPPNSGPVFLEFRVSASPIARVTAVHIHAGARGENGPVRAILYESPLTESPLTESTNSLAVKGILTQAGTIRITLAELCEEMARGRTYVDVHTATHLQGEIRGQISPRPIPLPFRQCGRGRV